MKTTHKLITVLTATLAAAALGGCAASPPAGKDEDYIQPPQISVPDTDIPPQTTEIPEIPAPPAVKTAKYITVTADGVNIRSGAGTGYSSLGQTEKSTMYAYLGKSGAWYKTKYKDKTAYISEKYCILTEMTRSGKERVESVIGSGTRFLGVKYVYGAVRFHDGAGNKLKNFTTQAFDCSSLMQYIFYDGAGELLNVTTRTQVKQGVTIPRAQLQRGDLMFFTNASRKNNKGIERIGHVALYLGDNLILHTASDYAKIEQISATRWGYFIQAQRII